MKPKILYVDDETLNVQVFKISFSKNFNVVTALSGKEGLDILEKESDIRFVISDMKMPNMNGLDFIRQIKGMNESIPCMILSGYQPNDEIQEALNSRTIIDYMMKPFRKEEIEKLIQSQIK